MLSKQKKKYAFEESGQRENIRTEQLEALYLFWFPFNAECTFECSNTRIIVRDQKRNEKEEKKSDFSCSICIVRFDCGKALLSWLYCKNNKKYNKAMGEQFGPGPLYERIKKLEKSLLSYTICILLQIYQIISNQSCLQFTSEVTRQVKY